MSAQPQQPQEQQPQQQTLATMRSVIAKAGGPGTQQGWSTLWQQDLTLWDLGSPTAALLDEFTAASIDGRLPSEGASIFIPGCGSAYDVAALAKSQFVPSTVVGLDVAPEAILRANQETTGVPNTSVVCGDFFTHPLAQFDFVFDYTFFCALPPSMRAQWGARTASLLKPGGRLLTLAFPMSPEDIAMDAGAPGPPHPVCERAYREALEPNGVILESGPYRNPKSVRESELVIWWIKE